MAVMQKINGSVTSEIIAEVRNRANIQEVISETVVLKRSGKDYKGLCPFHNEKTPSFYVNREKGIYKCFGCGEGGDVFSFVQKVRGLDFIASVKELAHKYNVALVETPEERQDYDKRTSILLLYQQACQYYSKLLEDPKEGKIARDYLNQRSVSDEVINKFKLGYAPNAWDGLLRFLTSANKVTADTLVEAGLVRRQTEGSGYFDLFRNRLIIPICDEQGRVIAFGGRTLEDDQIKYLNSPETPIYKKGQHLFAFHLAKEGIKNQDAVIVTEGYFDAITPHQYGFHNTVATLGTALTSQQAKLLVRYTESKRVYLAFDSDSAGLKAVERGGETLNQVAEGVGIDLRVIVTPGGKDPDECLKATNGRILFEESLKTALPLVDHQLHQSIKSIDLSTHLGRIEAAKTVTPILSQISNAVARSEYIRQLSLKLSISEEELSADVRQFRKDNRLGQSSSAKLNGRTINQQNSRTLRQNQSPDGILEAERSLLALFLTKSDDYAQTCLALVNEDMITPVHQRIKEAIYNVGATFNNMEDLQQQLLNRLAPDQEALSALVEVILTTDSVKKQDLCTEILLSDLRSKLIKERLQLKAKELSISMASSRDDNEQSAIQSKIRELSKIRDLLPKARVPDELDDLQRKLEAITS
jgi:DNA primase